MWFWLKMQTLQRNGKKCIQLLHHRELFFPVSRGIFQMQLLHTGTSLFLHKDGDLLFPFLALSYVTSDEAFPHHCFSAPAAERVTWGDSRIKMAFNSHTQSFCEVMGGGV